MLKKKQFFSKQIVHHQSAKRKQISQRSVAENRTNLHWKSTSVATKESEIEASPRREIEATDKWRKRKSPSHGEVFSSGTPQRIDRRMMLRSEKDDHIFVL